jgi:hypothetical protein
MIELKGDRLTFSFPRVHPGARLDVSFQRTLRIPDDDKDYPLPPGLGRFPLRHVDDVASRVPPKWLERGGVLLPMYQSEALWLRFEPRYVLPHQAPYPFALKVAAGKVNAVTGEPYGDELGGDPQDYVVAPKQPWLDGYCVDRGVIRQFVAMPLGEGYTAEEQLQGTAEHGGLQLIAYPMKRAVFERRFPKNRLLGALHRLVGSPTGRGVPTGFAAVVRADLGLAAGGRMGQDIYQDPFDFDDWDREQSSRCFVHIANSQHWHAITGEDPPTVPPSAKDYARAGLPWFDTYRDGTPLGALDKLAKKLRSIAQLAEQEGKQPLEDNESLDVADKVIRLRAGLARNQVREGRS